jgi:hypothetical protein
MYAVDWRSDNTALTRPARRASAHSAVVERFSRSQGRYERQGLLVEDAALDQAEQECLADEEARSRRRQRDEQRRAEQDLEFQAELATEVRRLSRVPASARRGHCAARRRPAK